jgi:uncharacterized protein
MRRNGTKHNRSLNRAAVEKTLRSSRAVLRARFGVKTIGLFGSFANGKPGIRSDVDILVEFSRPVGWEFLDVQDYLEARLGRKVDLVTERALRPQLRERILAEVKYA